MLMRFRLRWSNALSLPLTYNLYTVTRAPHPYKLKDIKTILLRRVKSSIGAEQASQSTSVRRLATPCPAPTAED
jgi:hypothetical protein